MLLFESTRFDWEGDDKKKNERVRKFFAAVPDVVEMKKYSLDEARVLLESLARNVKLTLGPGVGRGAVRVAGRRCGPDCGGA